MTPHLDTVTLIGVGLLGGSLGLALKRRGLARVVRGVGHRQSSLDTAHAVGAIDEAYLDAAAACPGAELIIVCTPADKVVAYLDVVAAHADSGAIITDVASTKTTVCRHADTLWSPPRPFVGSHPMAGSEKSGPEHANPDLYTGAYVLVEKSTQIAPHATKTIHELWTALGAKVADIDPVQHDIMLASTSHMPHVVAACLASEAAAEGCLPPFAGGGFRDMTRIAASRPEVWRDICLTNQEAIALSLSAMIRRLEAARTTIANGDAAAIETLFRDGGKARREVMGS